MTKYIDCESALAILHKDEFGTPDERWHPESEIAEAILRLPAADVAPVVRCGNCKHMEYDALFKEYWCRGRRVSPDFYCADGSEKEEGKE